MVRLHWFRLGKVRLRKVRLRKVRLRKVRLRKVRLRKVRLRKIRLRKVIQWTPLNGITLGPTKTDSINRIPFSNEQASSLANGTA